MKIIKVDPIKVGYNGNEMMKAASRGKTFDQNRIVRAEYWLAADGPAEFSDHKIARDLILRDLVRQPWAGDLVGEMVRQKSGPFQRDGTWQCIFEIG